MASIVVVGAGLAGVATAHALATQHDIDEVVVVDPRPPLTLTSDKSTECYRTWWPNRPMFELMTRSIDRLEEFDRRSGSSFSMNRRGYLFVTGEPTALASMVASGEAIESWGGGSIRSGDGYRPHRTHGLDETTGTDVLKAAELRSVFPYLTEKAIGAVHARRAGWLSAQQLGQWMIDEATRRGVEIRRDHVLDIVIRDGAVGAVVLGSGTQIECRTVVDAAGPMLGEVAALVDVALPVYSELHSKVAFRDGSGVVPRSAPMLIWCDPQVLDWSGDEAGALAELGRSELCGTLPPMCHGRPEGGEDSPWLLALWEYANEVIEPTWPLPSDELYPEVVMRGMETMIPGLGTYRDRLPQPFVDGGYYTRTWDNRPLVGRCGPEGFVVAGAMGGFGVMACAVVGELAAAMAAGVDPGPLAAHVDPARFDDPDYRPPEGGTDDGQL